MAAYSPLQRLETLRRNGLAFRPDLVIYSATTLDVRLMEIHLCEMLRNGVDLRYAFLKQAIDEAGVAASDLRRDALGELIHKGRLHAKLKPYYWGLYDRTLGMLAAECRSAGLPMVMVIIPRVGKEDCAGDPGRTGRATEGPGGPPCHHRLRPFEYVRRLRPGGARDCRLG